MTYTKLFSELIMSTVWREPDHVRILWITMLALKDHRTHVVRSSIPGLADAARISMDQCIQALEVLQSVDPYSRTTDFDGRRIQTVDGGWLILNGEKYKNILDADDRREYQRVKQQEYRKARKSDTSITQPERFSEAWELFPKRNGTNPQRDAIRAWNARLKEGISADAIIEGVKRYSAWCKATGKINTEYVMRTSTFFGPSKNWENEYGVPAVRVDDGSKLWEEMRAGIGRFPRCGPCEWSDPRIDMAITMVAGSWYDLMGKSEREVQAMRGQFIAAIRSL